MRTIDGYNQIVTLSKSTLLPHQLILHFHLSLLGLTVFCRVTESYDAHRSYVCAAAAAHGAGLPALRMLSPMHKDQCRDVYARPPSSKHECRPTQQIPPSCGLETHSGEAGSKLDIPNIT